MNLNKKNIITILAVIILLGAFLRFYKLGETSFVADEFLDINSSYAYAQTGIWQNWDFNFGKVNADNVFEARDERAWIYKWQVAKLFKIFPPTESVARSASVFWGILTIVLIYFAGSYFSKKKEIGLISAFLFAVSISGIEFDRKLRMYAMFFAVFLAFSWFVFRFLEEKYEGKNKLLKYIWNKLEINLIYLVPALILGVASVLTHQLTANIAFVFIIYSLVQIARNRKSGKVNKYSLGLAFLSMSLVLAFLFFPKEAGSYTAELRFFNSHWSYFVKTFSDYSHIILAFSLTILGSFFVYKKEKREKEAIWLMSSLGTIIFCAMFIWDRNVGDQYIFFSKSFLIILIASGIFYLGLFLKEKLSYRAFLVCIALVFLVLPNFGYFFQEFNTYNQTSKSDNPDFRKIFAYFKKSKNAEDVLITRNFRNYYWSGAKTKVFDFGGELSKEKLSLDEVKKIIAENSSGWFIFTDNDEDYIANDVITYAEKNMEKASNVALRGKISVYRWKNY